MTPSRPSSRRRTPLAALLALTLLAAPLQADENLEPLLAAVTDRVAELEALESPTKPERNELRWLGKAEGFLTEHQLFEETFEVNAHLTVDPHDVKRAGRLLVRTTSAIERSKTEDGWVWALFHDLCDRLEGLANYEKQQMHTQAELLLEVDEGKLDKAFARADTCLAQGLALWGTKATKGAAKLLRAQVMYAKGAKAGQRLLAKEAKLFPNDLEIASITITTPEIHVGHPIEIVTVIDSAQPVKEVSIVHRLVPVDEWNVLSTDLDDDADVSGPDAVTEEKGVENQYLLAVQCVTIEDPDAIDPIITEVLVVPEGENAVPPGMYYLAAEIDPDDRLLELLEDEPGVEEPERNNALIDDAVVITVLDDQTDTPNLYVELEDIFPEELEIFTTDDGVDHTFVGANLHVGCTGGVPVADVGLRAWLDVDLPGPGIDFSLPGLIHLEDDTDVEVLVLDELQPGEERTVHIDVEFDFELGDLVQAFGGTLRVTVDPDDAIAEYEDAPGIDNTVEAPLTAITAPDAGGGFALVSAGNCPTYATGFDKTVGNDQFGASVGFHSSLEFSNDLGAPPWPTLSGSSSQAGAVARSTAGINVTLFKKHITVFGFETHLERDPINQYGYFGVEMVVVNPFTLGTVNALPQFVYSIVPVDSDFLEGIPEDSWPAGVSVVDGGFEYDIVEALEEGGACGNSCPEFSVTKSIEAEARFYPAGIPVTVAGILGGELGFGMTAFATDSVGLEAGPFAGLDAGVEAKACIGKICVGAGGEITLVRDELTASLSAGMDAASDKKSYTVSAGFSVDNEITAAQGRLYVFADYPWFDWCHFKLFGKKIPYPCHFGIKHAELDILNWNGFQWDQNLASLSTPGCCVPLPGFSCPSSAF